MPGTGASCVTGAKTGSNKCLEHGALRGVTYDAPGITSDFGNP